MARATVAQCWTLARALDNPSEDRLTVAVALPWGAERDVHARDALQTIKARNWLDNISTYVETEDAMVRLPGWVSLILSDNNVKLLD